VSISRKPRSPTQLSHLSTEFAIRAKFFAVIIERNGQELARDILHIDGAADARRKLMQLVRQHEIDPFDEPINCRVEELSE